MMITYYVDVLANASRNEVESINKDRLAVKVMAPPTAGRANAATIGILAEYFGIAKNKVIVLSGEKGKHKRVGILYD